MTVAREQRNTGIGIKTEECEYHEHSGHEYVYHTRCMGAIRND